MHCKKLYPLQLRVLIVINIYTRFIKNSTRYMYSILIGHTNTMLVIKAGKETKEIER